MVRDRIAGERWSRAFPVKEWCLAGGEAPLPPRRLPRPGRSPQRRHAETTFTARHLLGRRDGAPTRRPRKATYSIMAMAEALG
jgi:hypothetical protein